MLHGGSDLSTDILPFSGETLTKDQCKLGAAHEEKSILLSGVLKQNNKDNDIDEKFHNWLIICVNEMDIELCMVQVLCVLYFQAINYLYV